MRTKEESLFGPRYRNRVPIIMGGLGILGFILAAARLILDGHFSPILMIQLSVASVFGFSALLFRTRYSEAAVHFVLGVGVLSSFGAMIIQGDDSPGVWLPFVPLLAAFMASNASAVVYTVGILIGLAFSISSNSASFTHFSLASAVVFGCGLGVFLEGLRIKYERAIADLATSHPLTGLPSRVIFDVLLERATGRFNREAVPFALVFIDVDGLKPVNDTFGHPAGDALLKEVARRLGEATRDSESVFHISGDEFVMIVRDRLDLEALKTRIRAIGGEFIYMNFRIPLSISVGAAEGTDSPETSLLAADNDMYVDKRSRSESRK